MALPKLNETPKFSLTIPSTGKKIRFRPYLVKEEKVLMMAFESKDLRASLEAVADTIQACIPEEDSVDVRELATFDIEYIFTKIRSKSVGEVSEVAVKCNECKTYNTVQINLDEVEVEKKEIDNMIFITDDIAVELAYPSYESVIAKDLQNLENSSAFELILDSIKAVHTGEERIDAKEESREDMMEFLMSLTSSQFESITDFLNRMPALSHKINFNCTKCAESNEIELRGMSDFF